MRILLVGQMARDDALAERLIENSELSVIASRYNPGLLEKVKASGGKYYLVNDICDGHEIAKIAKTSKAELFITHSDDALAADVAGIVKKHNPGILVASPDKKASRPEWDKDYLRDIVAEVAPKYNPDYVSVRTEKDLSNAIDHFKKQNIEIVVKPRNLTGGKGVKIMGPHFKSYKEATLYALEVLADAHQDGLLIEEKLEGLEYTVQAFTDGKTLIVPPITYDYPYREDGDKGPGTGGMGSFTMKDGLMPFLNQANYDETIALMRQILAKFAERSLDYKGVIYGSFFMTRRGIKIVEINARGGDPELVNIMALIDKNIDMTDAYHRIATGSLQPDSITYNELASAVIYLVAPKYAYNNKEITVEFEINQNKVASLGVKTFFSSAKQVEASRYSVGTSRAFCISALGATPWEAREKAIKAITEGLRGPLEWRKEVAQQAYIKSLKQKVG